MIIHTINNKQYMPSQDGLIKVLNHDKLKPYLGPHYPKWGRCALNKNRKKKQ